MLKGDEDSFLKGHHIHAMAICVGRHIICNYFQMMTLLLGLFHSRSGGGRNENHTLKSVVGAGVHEKKCGGEGVCKNICGGGSEKLNIFQKFRIMRHLKSE